MTNKDPLITSENQLRKVIREEIRYEISLVQTNLTDAFTKTATQFKSDILNSVDKVLKELVKIRTEKTVQSAKISEHSDRLEKLEDLHPEIQSVSI